ncbi:class I SAM-dependent methyltransferase [Halomonas sp. WWR20]
MEVNEHTRSNSENALSRRQQFTLFARNFFKHPKMLGSIIPSSPALVKRMLSHVDWQRARVLVEYGPGVGTFTKEMLRQMHPDATLIVLETNEDFVEYVGRAYPDPRLQVVHGSAEDIQEVLRQRGFDAVDYVVAGIPLSTLPIAVKDSILRATQKVIAPDGAFLLYQFSPNILPHLQRTFSKVTKSFEPMNFLPAHFYYCVP